LDSGVDAAANYTQLFFEYPGRNLGCKLPTQRPLARLDITVPQNLLKKVIGVIQLIRQ